MSLLKLAVSLKIHIGNNVYVKPYCVFDETEVGDEASIGPFAHLRPKTVLANKTRLGNFNEKSKKSYIGEGSKVNHLSYVGDAQIGAGVNFGAVPLPAITMELISMKQW